MTGLRLDARPWNALGVPEPDEGRLSQLASRLAELAEFGRDPHVARRVANVLGTNTITAPLQPAMSVEELDRLEQAWRVVLPEEYRAYLLHVSKGGLGPSGGLAAPEVALSAGLDVTAPFPALVLAGDSVGRRIRDVWTDPLPDTDLFVGQGVLPLADYGCAMTGLLVVTGANRGEVWLDDRGNSGCVLPWELYTSLHRPIDDIDGNIERRITGRRVSFLAWVEDWLDNALACAAQNPS